MVEAEDLRHHNILGGRKRRRKGGGTDTLIVGRFKITFGEKEEVDWLLLTGTCNIHGFYDGNVIEGSDYIDVNLQKIAGKLQDNLITPG